MSLLVPGASVNEARVEQAAAWDARVTRALAHGPRRLQGRRQMAA